MKLVFTFTIASLVVLAGEFTRGEDDSFHIYAPSRSTNELLVIKATRDENNLSLQLARTVDLEFACGTISTHPEKPLLYISALRDEPEMTRGAVVHLDSSGGVARLTPLSLHHGYAYLSLDRASRFLLGAHYFGGFVDVYALDENGIPGRRVTALDEGRVNAHCVLPSPDNRFVYIPYVKDKNALFQYRFDSETGALTALDPKNANPPAGTGPRHMAYHPKLPIVYFSNEQQLGVSVYRREKSGQLSIQQVCDAVPASDSKEGVSSSDIVMTPDGKFLFAGIRGHQRDFDWISRYQIQADGDVELLGLTPAGKIPWGFALSPEGRFLIVSAFEGATINAYEIGQNGELTLAARLACPKQISDLVTR